MYVSPGDNVTLVDADSPELRKFIGSKGVVKAAWYTYHPAHAQVLFKPNFQCEVYVSYLEVMPPDTSPFIYEEEVKVLSTFDDRHRGHIHKCNNRLIGKVGQIRGYDKRSGQFLVKGPNSERGWFPADCLLPITYKGSHFYYPSQRVIFKGMKKTIDQIKRTKNNYGQLLLLDGDWIPASDVLPTEKD